MIRKAAVWQLFFLEETFLEEFGFFNAHQR
jgi:hypothetical protein